MKKYASITALGGYVPETVLSNFELERLVDTSHEWIMERTGIRERRVLTGKKMATSDLAVSAIEDMLTNYQVDRDEIECIIVATATPDHLLASTASIVGEKINAKNCWGIDVNSACSGFLYALTLGASLLESDRYKSVLVVGADKMSSIVNYEDRNTCILFGDGAGAVLLEQTHEKMGLMDNIFKTDGSGRHYLNVLAGGSFLPATEDTIREQLHYVRQEGRVVFKSAVTRMSEVCTEILKRNELGHDDIEWMVPHQANLRIIESIAKKVGLPPEKIKINLDKYGNTTSATIPLCLWDYGQDFNAGDKLLLTAFGAGFSWGASLLTWGTLRAHKNAGIQQYYASLQHSELVY